jgi:NAD(P)-dependent dehydrogenase (short-subunit alcohol dehydrogenase family)
LTSKKNELSKDGFELSFQVNYLSHFMITISLQDLIEKVNGKIINTSSIANYFVTKIGFDGFKGEKISGEFLAYGRSKLYQIMFTKKLQQIFDEKKSQASIYSFHPGGVYTEIWGKSLTKFLRLFMPYFYMRMRTPEEGAATGLYICGNEEANKNEYRGKYFVSNKVNEINPLGNDQKNIDELWNLSMKLFNDYKF